MATVVLGSTPTTIDLAEATTNWTGDTFSLEPDIKVQGNNSVACVITPNAGNSQEIYVSGTWDFSGTGVGDQHLRLWANISFGGNLQTEANNGWQIYISDGTNSSYWTVAGTDTYAGGWRQFLIYTGDTPTEDSGTPASKASLTEIGMRFKTLTKPRNVPANAWFDAWRYGEGYYATGGTSGDEITLGLIAADDLVQAYGIVTEFNGAYFLKGDVQIGNGSTTTWFDADTEVAIFTEEAVNTGLYKFAGNGTGCRMSIADSVIKSAGIAAKDVFIFDMSETNLLTFSMSASQLVNAGLVDFKSGQTVLGNVFNNCDQITHAGADMDGSIVKNYEGTADTGAMVYDVAVDPNGEIDDATFTMGTALTHAIEFGTTSPLTMTLTGMTTSGYHASDAQSDSTFLVKRTGGTVTINVIGGSGNFSYKSAGATVVIVISPVTTEIHVIDINTGADIENARVLFLASDGTGDMPFEGSVISINRVTTVATVAHTAHGLVAGDIAFIDGANQQEYNGAQTVVTVPTVDSYTFTVAGTPTTPATGTITSTGGYFNELTNSSGIVTDNRSITNDQPLEGRVRKSTSSPLYKSSPIVGTVDSTTGLSILVQLIPDE